MNEPELASWRPGTTRTRIEAFLEAVQEVAPAQRLAVLDNDGTLWCERPTYVQYDFFADALGRAAADDPALGERPELRAVLDGDGAAIAEIGLPRVAGALAELFDGMEAAEFTARTREFVARATHPLLGRPTTGLVYRPMLELLDALRARDVTVCIVTGGGTEFVRAISDDLYGVPPERVVGTMIRYRYEREAGRPVLRRTAELDGPANEGAAKVEAMARHLGRSPLLAAGNSVGDREMLDVAAGASPGLALLVVHDDDEREIAYESVAGTIADAEPLADVATRSGWTTVSMRDDWTTVFADPIELGRTTP
ncbi:MAG: haloacid dehalogenase-like hydrolase [Acidimicrobiales bacterium]|nr:haloacid dehalogenase-like hydrolase [Acidimicrobiales bacterium]HRW38029.1 HAD family hydrolase [Aquihabitans sp.]